jgi:hypothetical protein
MSPLTLNVVKVWASRWMDLRAWGRPLEDVSLSIERWKGDHYGLAFVAARHAIVRVAHDSRTKEPDIVHTLTTLLHELAHLSAGILAGEGDGHSRRWREVYAAAVLEVTGAPAAPLSDLEEEHELDDAVEQLLRTWWKRSGNEFAYSLLRRAG